MTGQLECFDDDIGRSRGLATTRRMNVICLSSIDWGFNWQVHQQVMSTLAQRGHRVLFVENTGVRRPSPRDWPRLVGRLRNRGRGRRGIWTAMPNLAVCSPVLLPFPYSRPARWVNGTLLLRTLADWRRAAPPGPLVLWTFLPTPLALDLMTRLTPAVTVYHCVGDLPSSSTAAAKLRSSETRMLRDVDLVFVTSRRLRDRALAHRLDAHLVSFGVDFARFQAVRKDGLPAPRELEGLRRPLVGYVGGVHRWVDQRLLESVATAMPGATFVFLGPLQTEVGRLASLPNVRFLGARPHEELARYIKEFDVGIVPYLLMEYTAHVSPTKLNEYLAMGLPVVATALPEIGYFNERHASVVRIASEAQSFVDQLREAFGDGNADVVHKRMEIARANSWSIRTGEMTALVDEALGGLQPAARHA